MWPMIYWTMWQTAENMKDKCHCCPKPEPQMMEVTIPFDVLMNVAAVICVALVAWIIWRVGKWAAK